MSWLSPQFSKSDDLTHDYGEVVALSGLTLEVPPGVTGLVGANGAGKTTMLRLMLGLLHPTVGIDAGSGP